MTPEDVKKALTAIDPADQKRVLDLLFFRNGEIRAALKLGVSEAANFDIKCYLCTTAIQVAISAAVGVAWAGLVVGGEVAVAAVDILAAILAPIISVAAAEVAEFIISIIQNCSGPGQLVDEIAHWACKC